MTLNYSKKTRTKSLQNLILSTLVALFFSVSTTFSNLSYSCPYNQDLIPEAINDTTILKKHLPSLFFKVMKSVSNEYNIPLSRDGNWLFNGRSLTPIQGIMDLSRLDFHTIDLPLSLFRYKKIAPGTLEPHLQQRVYEHFENFIDTNQLRKGPFFVMDYVQSGETLNYLTLHLREWFKLKNIDKPIVPVALGEAKGKNNLNIPEGVENTLESGIILWEPSNEFIISLRQSLYDKVSPNTRFEIFRIDEYNIDLLRSELEKQAVIYENFLKFLQFSLWNR